MLTVRRFSANPILSPDKKNVWEAVATFNGCPIGVGDETYIVYRAVSEKTKIEGQELNLSTIGVAQSSDRVHFTNRRQFIIPSESWERFGCEDPRVTKIEGSYLIFYTALSKFPPDADSIKVALAISDDFKKIKEKHLVTPFNAKAMAMFSEKINGKFAAVLTVNTDKPPAKIAVAFFDNLRQIWDQDFWNKWYKNLDKFVIPLLRSDNDHLEVGAPPVKTQDGWLLIYSYIRNYFSDQKTFGIETCLLDLNNPLKKIGALTEAILTAQEDYELVGEVPNIVFPSGALVYNEDLGIYYGAADTVCCLATVKLEKLLQTLKHLEYITVSPSTDKVSFKRFSDNPIISPIHEHEWESRFTLNAGAVFEDGKVHILYRAQGKDNTSVLGYATSSDGVHLDTRLPDPVYVPREDFENKQGGGFSGCEDPRITKIGDKLYMCYTAFDGVNPPRVAFTSISTRDFLNKTWKWEKPVLISPPGEMDKNACILPKKINGRFAFFHRLGQSIWFDLTDDLNFSGNDGFLMGKIILKPRVDKWDSLKIGIGPPPLETKEGWILIYHGLSNFDNKYRLGAALLDLSDPSKIISRLEYPILEPMETYENKGLRGGTVFSCGAVTLNNKIFLYYGGADQFISVAAIEVNKLLAELKK